MDQIANFLTSIRNANAKGHEKTDVPYSKMKVAISKVLKDEGYIQNYRLMEEHGMPFLRIQLKYSDSREAVIKGIRRVSKPSLRIYQKNNSIKKVDGGMGVAVLTTSKGVLSDKKARSLRVGGEVICHVW